MTATGIVRIDATGLGKRYSYMRGSTSRPRSLRDAMTAHAARLVGRGEVAGEAIPDQDLWALRDVSFAIREGERIGIIGNNGAGKSTLLKILGRVTDPTTGRVMIRGRLASLLEVGTGFHPELSGRENIFLNGAILGMRQAEIQRKLDEIVAFAEVERFLDTPVKNYSSGMYVRLAFSIAAHLDADILVVDEVLAVGDIQFQKKCIQKMDSVATDGRTVLLVSHNMSTILGLSTRCMLLESGRLVEMGPPADVIRRYQRLSPDGDFGRVCLDGVERYGTGEVRFVSVSVKAFDHDGRETPYPLIGSDVEILVELKARDRVNGATVAVTIYDQLGARLIDVNTLIKGQSVSLAPGESAAVRFTLRNLRLKPDVYTAGLWVGIQNVADYDGIRYATSFRTQPSREDVRFTAPFPGPYACEFESRVESPGQKE